MRHLQVQRKEKFVLHTGDTKSRDTWYIHVDHMCDKKEGVGFFFERTLKFALPNPVHFFFSLIITFTLHPQRPSGQVMVWYTKGSMDQGSDNCSAGVPLTLE